MNKQVKSWIDKSKTDKDFTMKLAQKTLSEVLGKANNPSSLKIKVKFDKTKSAKKKTHHHVAKKERIF